jgi:hypothetical protein
MQSRTKTTYTVSRSATHCNYNKTVVFIKQSDIPHLVTGSGVAEIGGCDGRFHALLQSLNASAAGEVSRNKTTCRASFHCAGLARPILGTQVICRLEADADGHDLSHHPRAAVASPEELRQRRTRPLSRAVCDSNYISGPKHRSRRRLNRDPPPSPLAADEADDDADTVHLDDSRLPFGVPVDGLAGWSPRLCIWQALTIARVRILHWPALKQPMNLSQVGQ